MEHGLLDGFGQVLPQVEAVGDVDGVRGAEPGGFGVGGGAVAADDLHSGVGGQPGAHGFDGAVGQQVGRAAGLDVHQDGRVGVALAQCELIDPQHTRCRRTGLWESAYQPEQGGAACRDREDFREAGAGPAGQHQPEALQCGLKLVTSPSVPEGDTLNLLDERRPRTGMLAATEPANP